MDLQGLIERLDYAGDPGLLDPAAPGCPPGIAHHLRRARETCGLYRAYALRQPGGNNAIPVVYLCNAADDGEARRVHHRVWNQNLVPFLVVATPERFVLYSGFRYDGTDADEITHIVKSARMSLDAFNGLDACAIAEGRVWERWGRYIDPAQRVDWSLLHELEELGKTLIHDQGLLRHEAHALIGKYIYLHYLRDRNILSDEKLRDWDIDPSRVFTRDASVATFTAVTERLEEWLNGSVFPLEFNRRANADAAVQQTAAVLAGDRVNGQMHLAFPRYDFSHIPIETLSVIYQQFLHAEDAGKHKGAYYTPTFLVDLVLDEVATRRPLVLGVKILDPACGSGAFLVQVYRRLIEQQLHGADTLSPATLSKLLTDHIFGIDQDEDACRVAAFSLSLTLLDYVEPPDLRRFPDFKLPGLYGTNIVRGDFFAPAFPWPESQFEWILGNPPWVNLIPNKLLPDQEQAFTWMKSRQENRPTGGWQLAEAFLWKTLEHLHPDGAAGMLAPAMTLFKSQSVKFRAAFFAEVPVWCVANFANLAYLLFAARAALPTAILFFRASGDVDDSEDILSYAPFAVNQPTLLKAPGRRFREAWTLAINVGELRIIDRSTAARGDGLTWKLAMWGSPRDQRILERVMRGFPLFSDFRRTHNLLAHEGFQLRGPHQKELKDPVEFVAELLGKRFLKMSQLERRGRVYSFPASALGTITMDNAYARKRGGINAPSQVCRPPHIVMPRNRRWAIYDNEFLVIPHPQLGIAGKPGQESLLKALALYLISNFVTYHQLFYASEMGIQMSVADLKTLQLLPIPLDALSPANLDRWAGAYDALVECWHRSQEPLSIDHDTDLPRLERHANELVYDALGLSEQDRWLVEDLVDTRLGLIKGKMGKNGAAMRPKEDTFRTYGTTLYSTLDAFAMRGSDLRHQVEIWHGMNWGIVSIGVAESDNPARVKIHPASSNLEGELGDLGKRLRHEHTHWLYFERGLTIFDGDRVVLVKPMQRLHWLRSQALQDADNLIADALAVKEPVSWH